jgi:hypothetical protein
LHGTVEVYTITLEDFMLQFITILGISTILSVAAYKIQHGEIQEHKNLLLASDITTSEVTKISYLLTD